MKEKYFLKQTKWFFAILLVSAILFSCEKDDPELDITFQTNENSVSEELANEIAVNFIFQSSDNKSGTFSEKSEKITKKVLKRLKLKIQKMLFIL